MRITFAWLPNRSSPYFKILGLYRLEVGVPGGGKAEDVVHLHGVGGNGMGFKMQSRI